MEHKKNKTKYLTSMAGRRIYLAEVIGAVIVKPKYKFVNDSIIGQ